MTALLELRSVTKSFGGLVAVDDVTFGVERGESLGLIGPNGAGKSTAFGILMGDIKPDSGMVRLDGKDITRVPISRRVQLGIARTNQIPRPFGDMDVFDNVRVGSMPDSIWRLITEREPEESERELLARVGFGERESSMLPGQLSMGELRKLELARNLATGPQVLLLDEVFAGLTVGEIAQLTELLLDKREEGMTYMIVSHDLRSLAPLVDRVVVLSFGKLIAEGSFDDVIADSGVREAYLGKS